jgi:hypothetical protein
VVAVRPGPVTPPVQGRFEQGEGGLQPGGEPEDPDDPSSEMEQRLTVATGQPAGGLALSL